MAHAQPMMMPQARSSISLASERVMLAPRLATAAPVAYVYDNSPQQYIPVREPVRDLNVIITPDGIEELN